MKLTPRGALVCACLLHAGIACPLIAQTPSASPGNAEQPDETIVLSPFTVMAEEDEGYRATATLSGTRIKTDLRNVGAAISVVTEQFLKDTASRNIEELFVYTLGTEVGGPGGNYAGLGNGVNIFESGSLVAPNMNTRVRGLGSADNTRDFFRSEIPWDSYAIDRVDLQRGPNAILFGLGKPAGLANAYMKTANFKNSGSLATRFGSYGSIRGSLDLNRVILKDELAIRLDLLKDRTYFQQDPAYNDDQRVYAALRYDPKFLRRGTARTSFRVNYENGRVEANRPRVLPPVDRITPFFETGTTTVNGKTFNNLNQQTYDLYLDIREPNRVPAAYALSKTHALYQPAVTSAFGGNHAYFPDPTTGKQRGELFVPPNFASTTQFGIGPNGLIDRSIRGLPITTFVTVGSTNEIATRMGLPFAADYKNETITDPSIFDFYDKLIDGPNKFEGRRFDAANLVLSQTFLNNRLGFELAYDLQRYEQEQQSIYGSTIFITVDLNNQMLDGSPNPDVGRPMIVNRSTDYAGGATQTERESKRFTGFAELRAKDFLKNSSWFTKLLGRHVFTGVASEETADRASQNGARFAVNDRSGLLGTPLAPDRELKTITYLGPDVRGRSSPAGLNLSHVSAPLDYTATTVYAFDSHWKPPLNPALPGYVNPAAPWVSPVTGATFTESENPANYVGYGYYPIEILDSAQGDLARLTRNASKARDVIESRAIVWQGFFWDGLVVPTIGYREDEAQAYSVTAPLRADGSRDQHDASYVLPEEPYNRVKGTTRSYSLVVHTPAFIRNRLPAGLNFSLFANKSENFEPAAGRVDIFKNPLPAPTGETEDYGIVISAFDDRLIFKVNKYKSTAANASYTLPNRIYLYSAESRAWVWAKRYEAGLSGDPKYSGIDYNYGEMVDGVFVQTAEDRALQAQHVKAVLDNFYQPIWDAYGMKATDSRWQSNAIEPSAGGPGVGGLSPPGLTSLVDTVSKGYEFELNFRPIPNWDIAMNAAKTFASRDNAAGEIKDYIESRNAVWSGPAGDIRAYSGTANGTTAGEIWARDFYRTYLLQQMLNGSSVAELRPWRYNLVTTYRFTEGRLKGFRVGGGYRWEDKVVIGYPSAVVNVDGADLNSYDITKPFYGPVVDSVDLWLGYTKKITKRIGWNIQLNVRNAFGKNELVPINVQPTGVPAAYRIKEGPTWSLTNTINF